MKHFYVTIVTNEHQAQYSHKYSCSQILTLRIFLGRKKILKSLYIL